MNGPDRLVKLLASQGLTAKNLGRDIAAAIKAASACQPVIFDTAGTGGGNVGHYILASAYDAQQRFFGGVTISNAMRAAHGDPWATVGQIESYGLGSIRSVILAEVTTPVAPATGLGGLVVDGRTHQTFVDTSKVLANSWGAQSGIPAVVMMAISASESNWGNAPRNELFGVSCTGKWPCQTLQTSAGPLSFNAYPTANDAYQDWVDIVTHGRYANAYANLKAGGSGEQFVMDLQSAGYAGHHNAEDENWSNTVKSLMRQVQALL